MTHTVHANRLKAYIAPSKLYPRQGDIPEASQTRGMNETQTPMLERADAEVSRSAEAEEANARGIATPDSGKQVKSQCVPIIKILKRRGSGKALRYLVLFNDGTQSWMRSYDVCVPTKEEFKKRMAEESVKLRRTRKKRS